MKRLLPTLLAAGTLAACGSDPEVTPLTCEQGSEAFVAALASAPEQVVLEDGSPISACLIESQSPGELAEVGSQLIAAAEALNEQALRRPAGETTVELGYLVGAVERGASDTGGVHADLVRRINAAARFTDDGELPPASFERAFGTGYAAGRESG